MVGVVGADALGVVVELGLAGVEGEAGAVGGVVVAGAAGVGVVVTAGSALGTFTLVVLPVPEMWTLVMGALMLTFWNCMPMSPKPPSLACVWLLEPTTETMSLPDPASEAELPPFEVAAGGFEDSAGGAAGVTGAAATTGATGVALGHVAGVEVVEARVALLAGWVSAR